MEEINSKEGAKELWGKIDNIIFDCDGSFCSLLFSIS